MKMKKQLIGILLTLVMVLSLMPGMSLTVYADNPYASIKNTTTVVRFDSKDWYLIDYDSSTVTLLAKECVAASKYNAGSFVEYSSNPTVKSAVDTYYNSISESGKTAVDGNGMFLLTKDQANAITNADVRKCPQFTGTTFNGWWLCSKGSLDYGAAYVDGGSGDVRDYGTDVTLTLGVRPALKLNLSSVIFSSESNTFKENQSAPTGLTATKASSDTATDGKISGVTAAMEYQKDGASTWTAVGENQTEITGLTAGTYKVRYKGTADKNASPDASVVVGVKEDQTAPTGLTATKASSSTASDGKISGVTDAMEYQIDGATTWTAVGNDETEITGLTSGTYKVRYKGTADKNASPDASAVVGVKEDQTAPTGLTATKASSDTAADGKISGVTAAMEYQKDGASEWTAVGENQTEITGLTAGTYKVRYAETADKNASDTASVEVGIKANATVTKAPTAKNPTYNGQVQALVEAGTAEGGIMVYALGENATTAPADNLYTTSIPTGTDVGTYYVWYKVVGDDNHNDTEPAGPITVTIFYPYVPPTKQDPPATEGLTVGDSTSDTSADGTISGVTDQMEYSEDDGKTWTKVPEGATEITGLAPGEYLVRMAAKPGYAASEAVKLTVGDKLAAASPTYAALSGQDRQEADAIAAAHDADRETAAQMLQYAKEHGVSLDTVMLSPAALTALTGNADPAGTDFGTLLARMAKRDGKSVAIQWNAVNGADGYLVYGGKAGGKLKLLKTLTDTKYTQKKLKKKTFYKYTVVAYKDFGGKQLPVAASKLDFAVTSGGKYTNVKSLKAEATVLLGVGESKKLTVKQVRQEKKKKLKTYRKLAYESADPAVATVAADGTITAVGEGTTTIYVYAQNGLYRIVTVTVTAAPAVVPNGAEETNAEDALTIELTEPEADEIPVEAGDAVVEEEAPEEIAE